MAYIPLGGSEETHIIFGGDVPDHIAELEASEQRDLLKKLKDIAEQDAPPDSYVYENIGNVNSLGRGGPRLL